MLQKLSSVTSESQKEEEAEEEEEDNNDDDRETNTADTEEESTRSQLSYSSMSPKASPLPEGLGLRREVPL